MSSAWAANGHVIVVDSLADGSLSEACTLRDALRASASGLPQGACAAGQPGQNEIVIVAEGTLVLTEGALQIRSDVIITGPGADVLALDAGEQSRIFEADGTGFDGQAENVVISDLTVRNVGPNLAGGGAIFLNDVDQALIKRLVIRDGLRGGIRAEFSGNLRVVDTRVENTGWQAISANIDSLELDQVRLIDNDSGLFCQCELRITNSTISGNQGTFNAGGIETDLSHVHISDSEISGNVSGLSVGGLMLGVHELSMQRVTISGNTGLLAGGLLIRPLGEATVEDISVHDNLASGLGTRGVGGVLVNTRPLGSLLLSNSTISGNTGTRAGGIDFDDNAAGNAAFRHLTVTDNVAVDDEDAIAGGISVRLDQAALSIANSIVADNLAANGLADDLVAWTRDGAQDPEPEASLEVNFSLIEDAGGFAATGSGNILGQPAELASLADNGGPTLSHHPRPTSPALNAGDPAFKPPPEFDQRGAGFPRVLADRIDIGAVEADFDQIFADRFESP